MTITLTLFSVVMSIVCSSIILFIAGFLILHAKKVRWGLILFILLLGFGRLLFPIEFREAMIIKNWEAYPKALEWLRNSEIGGLPIAWVLFICWLVVSLVLILCFLYVVHQTKVIAERALPMKEGDRLDDICKQAVKELNYSGTVKVAVTDELDTAVSIGFFSPNILLMKEMLDFSDLELKGVVKHELVHYMRGDVGKLRLLILTHCLFWWNPIMLYFRHCTEKMMELECDERACQDMDEVGRKAYLRAITKVLRSGSGKQTNAGMGWKKFFSQSFLDRRFDEVLHPVKRHSNVVTYALAVLCVILFCASYSFIVQPGTVPDEAKNNEISKKAYVEETKKETDFLLKLPNGHYLYVSDMLVKKELDEEEINKEPYADLPIYYDMGEGE